MLATLNERGVAYVVFSPSKEGVASMNVGSSEGGVACVSICQFLTRCLLVTFKSGACLLCLPPSMKEVWPMCFPVPAKAAWPL